MGLTREFRRIMGHTAIRKTIVFGAVALLCAAVVWVVVTSRPSEFRSKIENTAAKTGMPVTVAVVTPGDVPARVTTLGEVVPRHRSAIRAQVAGRIAFFSDRLQDGMIVRAGEVLVGIEKSSFKLQLAEAQSRLKAARLRLLKEERETHNAKQNWDLSGIEGEPSSPLVLRQPHLEAARAEYKAAESALANARVQLGHTEISAPYDGVIMKRSVNPGETVFAGDEVAILYSLSAVEVGIHLDAAQWALLSTPIETTTARLTDPRLGTAWDAAVVRAGMHLDRQTRLRTLFLAVEDPLNLTPPLLPGTFVRVDLVGKIVTGLVELPEAAQTKGGVVWLVNTENRLFDHRTEPLFYGQGVVYIQNPRPADKAVRVAVAPNASFTNGLLVQPMEAKGND